MTALKAICGPRYTIVHLTEKFKPTVADDDWLSELGKEADWFIVSGDPRIARGKAEREAWRESGLTAFFFGDGFGRINIYEQAVFLFRRWPDIIMKAKTSQKGVGYIVHIKGKELEPIF